MANKKTNSILPILKMAMFLLATIGLVLVIRRSLILSGFMSDNNKPGFTGFDVNSGTTILHIVPGALFMLLGPLQFMPRIRGRHLLFHRWSGRVFIAAAYTIGLTSVVLSFTKPLLGGLSEAVASVFFSVFFLVCVSLSLHYILKKQVLLHREWMIRAFSLGLAIATVRLITVFTFIFFKVRPENFLGIAFWMGFTCHAIVAEVWINYTRRPILRVPKTFLFNGIRNNVVHP
ncbi:hypothetical protein AHMF7605_03635 [Adhaeribacter arboris]|uniref:DUF2306 domain-containing protein n=1 Tax=Adhaeribacter arboris TaxID=2072846 RepID=A0A2T2YAZ7_9BACT|nr:DUF2306 domain-containing protein [Adhaeribacter arboris]PSR52679.1 hypothetical protein AHMF7605_03635 [Adhaeribacter arboris]